MIYTKKISEWAVIEYLLKAQVLLAPLKCNSVLTESSCNDLWGADAMIEAYLEGNPMERFPFLVEAKSQNTPQSILNAVAQIKSYVERKDSPDEYPLIVVPYLSPEHLKNLENTCVSGIDMCGNGIIQIPNRLLIYRTGNPNKYPSSRKISNPYRGLAAIVARVFFSVPQFESLKHLHETVNARKVKISLSQVSKAVSALEEELIIASPKKSIYILDPEKLLLKLAANWKPQKRSKIYLRLRDKFEKALSRLNDAPELEWAVTGESSVQQYMSFSEGGVPIVAVSKFASAMNLIDARIEHVPNFADVCLVESAEPGYYFENLIDVEGVRWASKLQTWIELKNGDSRQQDAASSLYQYLFP